MKTEKISIGIAVEVPKHTCTDLNCPFHGYISVRGRQCTGTVISTRMKKTAVVEFDRLIFFKKYERYEKRRTKLKVHSPECIGAKEGDKVRMAECRPLSKTKNFVIIEKLGAEKGFMRKMEAREAGKISTGHEEESEANKGDQ
mgnify:CR=1 FL=1